MEGSEHRALWGALGVALLISGLVVLSDWTFVVAASTSTKDLAALWWPWAGAVLLMFAGVYCLAAVSNDRLKLPGRAKVIRAQHQRRVAQKAIGDFHAVGTLFIGDGTVPWDQVRDWRNRAYEVAFFAFGAHQAAGIMLPFMTKDPDKVMALVGQVNAQIGYLIERCSVVPVNESFEWEPSPEWAIYLDTVPVPGGKDGKWEPWGWRVPK